MDYINTKKIYMYRFPCKKVYIGQTIQSMKSRWREGYNNSPRLLKVITAYTSKNPGFKPKVKILASNLTEEEANELEKYYIKYYREKLGYDMVLNDQDGGIGNTKKVCQYSYDGLTCLNKYNSIEEAGNVLNIGIDHIGHCLRNPSRNYTAGGYRWYYDNGKKYPLIYFPKNDNSSKPVKQIDAYTRKIIASFDSAHEAARETGIDRSLITKCLHNPEITHTAGGYVWEYDDGKNRPIWYLPQTTQVVQKDKNNLKVTATYNSIKEASSITGINKCNISACIAGRQQTAGGYIFEKKNFIINNEDDQKTYEQSEKEEEAMRRKAGEPTK